MSFISYFKPQIPRQNGPHMVKQENYSLRPTLFVLFEKSNILREHHLLSCLLYKNV